MCHKCTVTSLATYATCHVDCKSYLNNSLFIVGEFGGNDYNAPLFGGKGIAEVKGYVPQIVNKITSGVEVYNDCAVKEKRTLFS